MIFAGKSEKGEEYIVNYIDDAYPYKFIVKFPDRQMPIRVDFNMKTSCGETFRGDFMIPAESHKSYNKGWQVYRQGSKMMIADQSFGDIVFLDETDGHEEMENFVDFPDDIFGYAQFINFGTFFIVRFKKKYFRTNDDYKTHIVLWSQHNKGVRETSVITEAMYRDGGTFEAKFEIDGNTHDLYIPTPFKQNEKARLDSSVAGDVIREKDNDYWQLWNEFRNDSGLKLYYVDDK